MGNFIIFLKEEDFNAEQITKADAGIGSAHKQQSTGRRLVPPLYSILKYEIKQFLTK
jgi:hypothetical protein